MVKSWWDAHELEVIVTAVATGLVLVIAFVGWGADAWREWRKQKRDGIR